MAGILSKSGGILGNKSKATDLNSLEGLTAKAQEVGLGQEAKKVTDEPKLSFLQRLSKGLGAFNPAEAILTGIENKSVLSGVGKYASGVAKGIGSAITGNDYEGERRYFADVAEKAGVKNGILKFGIGFAGDILLDPTTYFGGAIAKGLGITAKGASKIALRGIERVAPETAIGLKIAGEGLQDALGRAFQYGYKSSEGAKESVLTFLSKSQQAKLGLAASNLDRLGTGILTNSQREELALKLIAGKRAEFIAREAGKSIDEAGQIAKATALQGTSPEVANLIQKQTARGVKFGEQIGLENPYEVYFPFIKKDKLQKFLNESRGIKIGSEGYVKQFKNLLTNEAMELDPAKAFFTRESQIVSDKMTRDFLGNFVKNFGKPLNEFKSVDDAIKQGYTLIKEKGNFGKDLGYVNKYDGALIRDSISPEFQTINMLAKATGFDAVTSLFKRSVTGLFAPFHIRNFVSGNIQNFEVLGKDALNPKNIAVGQKIAYLMGKGEKIPAGLVELGGKTKKFSEIMKPFVDRFSGDTFYNNDFLDAIKKGTELKQVQGAFSKEALKTTAKTLGFGQEGTPFKVARAVGQFIEHQQKATAYVTALGQGKTIQQALSLAERAGFDYRALTRFESQIMRRILPFYSFTRKNLELQLKTLGENPQRINQVLSFFNNISELNGGLTPEQKRGLPDYLKEQILISFGINKEGQPIVSGGFGTPIEQPGQAVFGKSFSDSVRRIASQLNPIIKTPLEKAFGKDFFQNREIKDIYDASAYNILPKFIKDFIGFKEVQKDVFTKNASGKLVKTGTKTQYQADPEKLHILRNLPTSRLFGYLYEITRTDNTPTAKTFNLTTGVKPKPIDLETVKYFRDRDKMRELEDLLIRTGVIKKFENTYIPKDSNGSLIK